MVLVPALTVVLVSVVLVVAIQTVMGVPADAVGCLPAPLRCGLRQAYGPVRRQGRLGFDAELR